MLLVTNALHELQGIGPLIALCRWRDNAAVPDGMEISRKAHENYRDIVAATVMIIRDVKWLVNVANKMNDVLESFEPLAFRELSISQLPFELFDLSDNASV